MKRIMIGKSISLRGIRVLLPRFALKLPLNVPSGSIGPPARTRKNPIPRAAVPSVQTERVWRRLLDGSRPVFSNSGKRRQFSFGRREVSAASGVLVEAASRMTVFVGRGKGLGGHTPLSRFPAGADLRDGKLRRAASRLDTAQHSASGFLRERFQPVAEKRLRNHFLKALPAGVASPVSSMPKSAYHRARGEGRSGAVFPSRPGSMSLREILSHQFFSTRHAPINARKLKNSSAQADGMVAAPPSILGRVARMRSLQQDSGRNDVISVVPDFLEALRRDHVLAGERQTTQVERDAVDQAEHLDDSMGMPGGQGKSSDLFDGIFSTNSARMRTAMVDEIAVPQYPNMSFGFM